MMTEEGKTKDDEIIDKEGIKDGKIIKGINKIEMVNLAKLGIIEIITIEIMEIDKEGIWSVSIVKKKDIERMIVHYVTHSQAPW